MFPGHHASPSNSGFTGQQQSQDVPPTNNTGFFFSYTTAVASSISYITPPAAAAAPRVGYAQQSPYHPNHANLNTNLHSRPPPPLMNFFRVPTYRNIRVFGTASPQNLPLTRPPSTYLHNNASNNQMLMLEVENHARPALTYANGFESFPNSSNSVISVENNFHPNNSPSIAVAASTTNNNKTAKSQSTHKTLDYSTVNSGNPQIESPNSDDESLLESPISVNVSNSSKQQIESTIFEEEQQPVESMCSNQQQKESTNASKKQQTELIVSKTVEEESPESHTHHTAADLRGCDITQEQQDQQKNFSSNSNNQEQLQIGTTNSNQHQKHPENQIESIPSSNSNKTDSSESIELLPMSEDEESYEEQHKEDMGKNWRIRMLFNGQVKDADLPAGCGRPQTNQGKQFPYPECASAEPHPLGEWESVSDDEEEKQQEAPVQQRQRNAKRNVAGIPLLKETAAAPSTSIAKVHNSSYGYVLPNGTTWVRRRPADGSEQLQHLKRQQQQQKVVAGPSSSSSAGVAPPMTIPNSKLFTGPNTTIATTKAMRPTPVPNFDAPTRPVVPPTTARASTMTLQQQPKAFGKGNASNTRFTNNSLRIMNGKRLYAGNRDCYQFVQTGACQNGIFCIYEHNGGMEHANQRICNRLLRGLCREQDDNCPGGPHSPLLPHQRPVCDFFLRMSCSRGKDNCPYVHCRHTAGTEPCVDFNRGCCLRGPLCDNVHRYFYSTIKQKSSDQQQHQKMASKNVPTHPNPNPANNQENPPLQRQSRQTPTPPNPTKSASPLPASLQWIT